MKKQLREKEKRKDETLNEFASIQHSLYTKRWEGVGKRKRNKKKKSIKEGDKGEKSRGGMSRRLPGYTDVLS